MTVLLKFIAREIKSRPGRATLTVLSIVIGVAAVVAVNVATTTTSQANKEMYESLAGRAALEVVAEGGVAFEETIVPTLEQVPGVKVAVPLFQQPTTLYHGSAGTKVRMQLMGIDPAKDEAVRDYKLEEGQFFADGEGVLLEVGFARGLGIRVGDVVKLFTGGRPLIRSVPVVGMLSPQGAANFNQGGIVFLPLATMQEFFRQEGNVNAVSIVLEESADEQKTQSAIARLLPVGLTVRPPAFRTQLAKATLQDVEQGLSYAYQLTLCLAGFMILNTFLMNVGERRRQLAIMRAIGTTRQQLMRMMLAEGLLMGVVGTIVGSLLGLGGAYFLSGVMSKALSVSMPSLCVTPGPFLLAALLGPGLALLAMYIPARMAGKVTPLEGMRPQVAQEGKRVPLAFSITGLVIFVATGSTLAACVLHYLPIKFAIPAGVAFTAALVLLIPAALGALTRAVTFVLHPILRFEGELARRQVLRRRARTTLTVGVLYIAVSSGIGLGTTIINNVQDVRNWQAQTMAGDFFVRAMFADQVTGQTARMPEAMSDEIRAVPGVIGVDSFRMVDEPVTVDGQPASVLVRGFTGVGPLPLDLKEGNPEDVRRRLFGGEVVVGSVLLQRLDKKVGDEITMQTASGPKRLRIAGMTTEYLAGGIVVQMEWQTCKRLLGVQGVGVFMIQAAPDALADVETRLKLLADQRGLMLHSFADLRRRLDGITDGVIASLWGLLALGFVVAAFGIANTLTMNVLEQTRELAMLRVVAMTRRQVRKTILSQATIIGMIGLVSGICGGVVGSYVTNLCAKAILGHAVEFALHPSLLALCFGAGFAIVLAAALLPAERAARLNLLIALQYE